MHYSREESGKETSWSRTLRNWKRWTSMLRDLLQRKCWRTKMVKHFFLDRRWNGKTFWRRSGSENIHLNLGSPRPGRRTRKSSRRIRRVFFNPSSRLIFVWWWNWKWFLIILFTVITWKPESHCMCREKHHSLFHWNTSTWPGLQVHHWMQCWKNIDDYWNVDGDRELSDAWTGFTRFTFLDEKPPDGFTRSGERLTRKQTTSRPDTWWPEIWKDMSEAPKRKEKQKWTAEKPRLDIDNKLRGFFHQMKNSRILWKTRGKSWKFWCQHPCLARSGEASTERLAALLALARQNMHASLKPKSPRESAWKDLFIKIMKIILLEKEWIHWLTAILYTNLFLCLKQWKYLMRKLQWIKNGKTWEDTSMAADESQKQKSGDRWSKEWGQNSAFCIVNGRLSSVISRMRSWNQNFKNTKVEFHSEVTL